MINKQSTTVSNVNNDDSRMLDDEEEKGQGPLATGADQFNLDRNGSLRRPRSFERTHAFSHSTGVRPASWAADS
jgi:hypothetical protein